LKRIRLRASRNAAGVPISIERTPVPRPTSSERITAWLQSGEAKISRYQCSVNPCGGQLSPPRPNESGIISSAGMVIRIRIVQTMPCSTGEDACVVAARRRGASASSRSVSAPRQVRMASPMLCAKPRDDAARRGSAPVMVERPSTAS
jgi:hypothetical protein